ncbi:co-chaperone GroES [candidate division WWE3 bacterium]|nr:co-chaperone GroES [candidate division WWE3 bacterium]
MKKIKPLFDYLLIEPMEKETTLPSGIVIPDSAKEKPQQGKVIAAGPGAKDADGKTVPMQVKVDDIVMYKKWGGTEIQLKGKDYILVKQEDLLAIIEE